MKHQWPQRKPFPFWQYLIYCHEQAICTGEQAQRWYTFITLPGATLLFSVFTFLSNNNFLFIGFFLGAWLELFLCCPQFTCWLTSACPRARALLSAWKPPGNYCCLLLIHHSLALEEMNLLPGRAACPGEQLSPWQAPPCQELLEPRRVWSEQVQTCTLSISAARQPRAPEPPS